MRLRSILTAAALAAGLALGGAAPAYADVQTPSGEARAAARILKEINKPGGKPIFEDLTFAGCPIYVQDNNDALAARWAAAGFPDLRTWLAGQTVNPRTGTDYRVRV